MNVKIFLLVVWSLFVSVGALAVPVLNIEPSAVTTNPNREFTVEIKVNTDQEIYGAQFDLVYDQNLLELLEITEGSFLNRFANTYVVYRPSPGRATYAITRTVVRTGVADVGTLASARFRALRTGQSDVRLMNVKIADPAIRAIQGVRSNNGVVAIYPVTTTTQPQAPGRGSSGGGGGGSGGGSSPTNTLITSGTVGPSERELAEQGAHEERRSSSLALQSQEREQERTAGESRSLSRNLFPLFLMVVAALGAFVYAYRRLG